jgi:hypothetical protein
MVSELPGVRLGGEAQWTGWGVQRLGGGAAHLLQGCQGLRSLIQQAEAADLAGDPAALRGLGQSGVPAPEAAVCVGSRGG